MALEMLQTGEASLAGTTYMRSGFVCFWWGEVVGVLGVRRGAWSSELASTYTRRRTREKQFESSVCVHCTAERANIERSHTVLSIVHPTIGGGATG